MASPGTVAASAPAQLARPQPPTGLELWMEYIAFTNKTNPCATTLSSCAVRMSVALNRCADPTHDGFEGHVLDGFPDPKRVHHNRLRCKDVPPHVPGATELFDYLATCWGVKQTWRGKKKVSGARDQLNGRHGIIYFNNCFIRTDGTKGDHIDVWYHCRYGNQSLGIGASGKPNAKEDLFDNSNLARFIALS